MLILPIKKKWFDIMPSEEENDMLKLFDCYYTNSEGKELKVRYCCEDKEKARRLFFSEIQKGEELKKIVQVRE